MENLKCCSDCNGVFIQENSTQYCAMCIEKNNHILNHTKEYIMNTLNTTTTMKDILEATGATAEKIQQWIQEGELQIGHLTNFRYDCEVCNVETFEGRLCRTCHTAISASVSPIKDFVQMKVQAQH